tara:strand:+ start:5922 stop:10493 length:4572 start_codon:yes stop_codon:yes gene_type:complete
MPNAINPNDYNVEFFNTVFQGTTTVEDFREYLFSRNLPNLPPELVNSPAGNFEPFYGEKGLEKDINYTPITNPGDLDEWFLNGGQSEDADDVRYQMMSPQEKEGKKGSQYGPASFISYNCPNVEPSFETGFIQYQTSSGGGDFKDLLKTTLIDGQLNLGPGAAIDFKSDLADLGKERRKQEVINRLKLKGENLLGKINLDPLGLLSGQDLILRDYDITVRPGKIGKLIETATDFIGFEIPASSIPAGAFGQWDGDANSGNGPNNYEDIMKSTGSATKSLIFKTIARNAYGPILEERPTGVGGLFGRIGNALSSGQAPQLRAYTDPLINEPVVKAKKDEVKKPLVDKINNAVGKIVDGIAFTKGVGAEEDGPSSVFKVGADGDYMGASTSNDDIIENLTFGFSQLPQSWSYSNNQDTWGVTGPLIFGYNLGFFTIPIFVPEQSSGDGPITTGLPAEMRNQLEGNFPHGNAMFWGETPPGGTSPFNRGILKFTQDLINNSNGRAQSKGRYIGAVNSSDNIKTKGESVNEGKGRHDKFSMGNTVAKNNVSGEEDPWYCRSWSVRNPYSKVEDLIRHGVNNTGSRTSLTRPDFNLSVLGDNGFVKVAPYVGDSTGGADGDTLKLGNPSVQKYMLSLENLAWQNSEEILKVAPCEVGPNGGRMMWFPPYDINFTDNSSVNWDSTSFIGRGEPIYTYNNTERTGTLSFKVVVDHSMALTEIKKQGDNALFQYFAGCDDMIEEARKILPVTDINNIVIDEITDQIPIPFIPVETPSPPEEIIFYFRHAYKFEKDEVGTNLLTELGAVVEGPPSYPEDIIVKWDNGYLRGTVPTTPPLIPNPTFGLPLLSSGSPNAFSNQQVIPNPAFSASTLEEYTSAQTNSLNQLAVENLDKIVEFLLTEDGKRFQIQLYGTCSESGATKRNKALGKARWTSTEKYLYDKLLEKEATMKPIAASNLGAPDGVFYDSEKKMYGNADSKQKRWLGESRGENKAKQLVDYDVNDNPRIGEQTPTPSGPYSALSVEAKLDRSCIIKLVYNPELDEKYLAQRVQLFETIIVQEGSVTEEKSIRFEEGSDEVLAARLAERAKSYLAWECSYFEKMKQDDSFVYESLTEKLKYFHPAFHSMTPEGFNARLTFLKQCTRQGPNIAKGEPSNMAFGKPPICVLRIGDFYHTKIVIDTVNFTFDPLQWDLNPEGIGVQPMICNVDLNFKFIGGSSLGGPISQLQNAVSHNFFANTGLYLPRTIYKSAGKYKQTRRDPITNQMDDISNVDTRYNKDQAFAYGAYVSPNQVIGLNGEFGDENKILTPPKDPNEEKVKQQQAQAQQTITPAKIDDDTQKQIDEAFDKKVEDRAGAFKVNMSLNINSSLKNKAANPTSIDLGQALYNGVDRGQIKPLLISINSSQESLEQFEVTYPNGTRKVYTREKWFTSSYPNGIQGSENGNKWITLWDPVDRTKSFFGSAYNGVSFSQGIEPGTYKFRGIASVEANITEDAKTGFEKIQSNTIEVKILVCGKTGSGNVVSLTDIPETGAC